MQRPRLLDEKEPSRRASAARLAMCVAAVAACWLLVLPQIAEVAPVRRMIDRNEALGIDPSAKFYSELPAMPKLLTRVEQARRQHRGAFEF